MRRRRDEDRLRPLSRLHRARPDRALISRWPEADRELAEALQLVIEYDPEPPYGSGSPENAGGSTLRLALRVMLGDRPLINALRLNRHAAGARLRRLVHA